ncbi:MAG: hypothetical protein ACFFD8_00865 [Candidatus Thorarchaeota archaeon]
MSNRSSAVRSLLSRFGTVIEAVFVFILLISGVAMVFIGKQLGQLAPGIILSSFGIGVEIIAIIIVGVYFYFRMLRRRTVIAE